MENAFYFEYKGGLHTPSQGSSIKFLMFLVNGGKEIPVSKGLKYGMIKIETDKGPNIFSTNCAVVKILVHETVFREGKVFYPFYILLGKRLDGQRVTLKPYYPAGRSLGWIFQADGRFLKKSEAMDLVEAFSLGHTILRNASLPPREVIRKIASVEQLNPKAKSDDEVRFIRVRENNQEKE